MSQFLNECAAVSAAQRVPAIRIAEGRENGEIETAELCPANRCQNVYSVAKTFTMTTIGLLYDRGLVRLEDKVCDLLADELPESGMDPRWRDATVEMALRHRLGLPARFLDIDITPASTFGRDYLRYMLTTPLECAPDTVYQYTDGAFYLLSRIAEKRAGMPIDDYFWQELGYPLDYAELAWSHCPLGHPMGATGLYVTAPDMVKLGLIYLSDGVLGGRRYLSEEWVRLAFERNFTFSCGADGTLWYKGGMHGQKLYVDREARRVVAVQSYGADTDAIAQWIREHRGL